MLVVVFSDSRGALLLRLALLLALLEPHAGLLLLLLLMLAGPVLLLLRRQGLRGHINVVNLATSNTYIQVHLQIE
jgi:hypothetical protein